MMQQASCIDYIVMISMIYILCTGMDTYIWLNHKSYTVVMYITMYGDILKKLVVKKLVNLVIDDQSAQVLFANFFILP